MHECVLVACAGDDKATEKSESSTRSLMQPTMPFAYLPPVVLTTSGAPPLELNQHEQIGFLITKVYLFNIIKRKRNFLLVKVHLLKHNFLLRIF